jgi:hypothetical protein
MPRVSEFVTRDTSAGFEVLSSKFEVSYATLVAASTREEVFECDVMQRLSYPWSCAPS